jgi:hypothetical protein
LALPFLYGKADFFVSNPYEKTVKRQVLNIKYGQDQRKNALNPFIFNGFSSFLYVHETIHVRGLYVHETIHVALERGGKLQNAIINTDTGEIIDYVNEGDTIFRKESKDFLLGKAKIKYDSFGIYDDAELQALSEELDVFTFGVIAKLMCHLKYESNMLAYKNGKPITAEGMAKMLKISRAKTYSVISKLIDLDVICKVKNSRENQYYMNPFLAYRGKYVQKVLSDMFRNYKRRAKC